MEIPLQANVKNKKIHIINTFSPHMRYCKNERSDFWEDVMYIIDQTKTMTQFFGIRTIMGKLPTGSRKIINESGNR